MSKKQTFTPEQIEQKRLYAAAYRAKNPTLPKTPEQMEKRRLWQIEYRKNNPAPKQTEEQKAKRAERQKAYRAELKQRTEEQKQLNAKAKAARIEAKKVLRKQLQAEKEEARRLYHERKLLTAEQRKDEYNQKQRDKYHQRKKELGIVNKKSGPIARLKPMTVHTPKVVAKALPNRVIDLSKCIPLQLDAKTMIYIRKDQDPEVIRQRFLNRRG